MAKIILKNIPPGKSSDDKDLTELLLELDALIPNFVESAIYKRDIIETSNEDHFTETLIKYLENVKCDSRFSFKQQASLLKRRSTDIGVHLKANSEHYIFNIEAKFLPPKDYVTGDYAAIKRFRKGEHGLSSYNPLKAKKLPQSAIAGYSKSGTFDKHLNTINKKIVALAKSKKADKFGLMWRSSEQLKKITFATAAKLESNHQRLDGSLFRLHHFWVHV